MVGNYNQIRGVIMFEDGVFGGIFNLNSDGKLDSFEQSLELLAISELLKEDEGSDLNDDF